MAETISKSVTINAPVSEVFECYADYQNFPYFMKNIKSVTKTSDKVSHWVMEGPMGKDIEWDAVETKHEPNKAIAYSSVSGDIKTSGEARFEELGNNQTQVSVFLTYEPKGKVGETIVKMFDDPGKKLQEDLYNFRSFVEQKTTTGGKDAYAGGFSGGMRSAEVRARGEGALDDTTGTDLGGIRSRNVGPGGERDDSKL